MTTAILHDTNWRGLFRTLIQHLATLRTGLGLKHLLALKVSIVGFANRLQ
jgi:hypothetical protein